MTKTAIVGEGVTQRDGAGPLQGVRVVDVSENLAGPFCAQILGDLGAEVMKVERPGGDPARAWGPPFVGSDAVLFLAANRNKRGCELDLRTESGAAQLWQLIDESDVFVQSFRPGVIERLGFGADAVRARNSRIIYCSISAYGTRGPLRDAAGYDPLLQAFSGLMSVTGESGGEPVRLGSSPVDMGAGMWLAIGVLGALRERERTGVGTRLDVSLLGAALNWMGYHFLGLQSSGRAPARHGTAFPSIAPYESFETMDGRLMIAAANDGLFCELCAVLRRPDLASDGRYANNALRVANRVQLRAEIAHEIRTWSTATLAEAMLAAGVPCSPIQDAMEAFEHPQTAATGLLVDLPGSGTPDVKVIALPIEWDGEVLPVRTGIPRSSLSGDGQ
jgi:formyl-CoA transferase/CoA:oxalate CoA-transferase